MIDNYDLNIIYGVIDDEQISKKRVLSPPLDIYEDKTGLHIEMEIADIDKENIKILCENNRIKIKGKKCNKKTEQKYILMERVFGEFEKIIELPFDLNDCNLKATLKDGVLNIFIPFMASKTIEISIEENIS